LGYSLADFVAARISAQRDSKLVRAVRANQWVIRGETLEKDALDKAIGETFQYLARSIFDLYHYNQNLETVKRLIVLDPTTQLLVRRPEFGDRGLMIVGLHISNFDLVLQTLCQLGLRMIVLTIPNPQGGRRMEFEMRRRVGMNIMPASVDTFRTALKHLQKGGVVLTGIDRPAPEAGTRPQFFGRPAELPTHHIFLAAKARVPVMIIATSLQPDGKYHISTSDLIEMDHHSDREKGMILNAEKVLRIAESFIRQVPQQWLMSLPVWPETLDLVPD
jgi:KDO2-lipid IV(A) lauroyltransferase